MRFSTASDENLMVSTAQDELAPWNELLDRFSPRLYNFLYRVCGTERAAMDLAGIVWADLYTARSAYDPTREFSTTLFALAWNRANKQAPAAQPMPAPAPGEQVSLEWRAERLRLAILSLAPKDRAAISLAYLDNLHLEACAGVLAETSSQTANRVAQAWTELSAALGENFLGAGL